MKSAFEACNTTIKNHFNVTDEQMIQVISKIIDKAISKGEFSVDTYIMEHEVSDFVKLYLNNQGYQLRYHQHEADTADKIYFSTLYISWAVPESQITPTQYEIIQDKGRIYS